MRIVFGCSRLYSTGIIREKNNNKKIEKVILTHSYNNRRGRLYE